MRLPSTMEHASEGECEFAPYVTNPFSRGPSQVRTNSLGEQFFSRAASDAKSGGVTGGGEVSDVNFEARMNWMIAGVGVGVGVWMYMPALLLCCTHTCMPTYADVC
jgi:hypothetical protein